MSAKSILTGVLVAAVGAIVAHYALQRMNKTTTTGS